MRKLNTIIALILMLSLIVVPTLIASRYFGFLKNKIIPCL